MQAGLEQVGRRHRASNLWPEIRGDGYSSALPASLGKPTLPSQVLHPNTCRALDLLMTNYSSQNAWGQQKEERVLSIIIEDVQREPSPTSCPTFPESRQLG